MATKYWIGGATAVAQVWTASIDSVDGTPANNTFTVTIGTEAVSVTGDTDVATTATALRAALNASTHPYFAAITWSGTGGDIIGTADTAGVPFDAALTETGAGTGSVTDFAVTTANAGPRDWATAANWSDGAVPVNADTVIIKDTSQSIYWGLGQSAVTLALLRIDQTFTGKIGLPANSFATSEDAATTTTSVPEYRDHYLDIGYDEALIGQHLGPGTPAGSTRIKLDNAKSGTSLTTIYNTNSAGESQKPAVRLLAANAGADLFIRACPGGVGLANDEPGETSTFGDVYMLSETSSHAVYVGPGVTLTAYEQRGGNNVLQAAATVTTVEVNGGTLRTEGAWKATTMEVNGGTCYPNNRDGSAIIADTMNHNGGTVDLTQSAEAGTLTDYNPAAGATLIYDDDVITFTTFDTATGVASVQWS